MMTFMEHLMGLSSGRIVFLLIMCVLISIIAMMEIRSIFDLEESPVAVSITMYIFAIIFAPIIAPIFVLATVVWLGGILLWEFTWL